MSAAIESKSRRTSAVHDSRSRWNRPVVGGLALWFGSHLAVAAIAVLTHILSPDRTLSFGTSD